MKPQVPRPIPDPKGNKHKGKKQGMFSVHTMPKGVAFPCANGWVMLDRGISHVDAEELAHLQNLPWRTGMEPDRLWLGLFPRFALAWRTSTTAAAQSTISAPMCGLYSPQRPGPP